MSEDVLSGNFDVKVILYEAGENQRQNFIFVFNVLLPHCILSLAFFSLENYLYYANHKAKHRRVSECTDILTNRCFYTEN